MKLLVNQVDILIPTINFFQFQCFVGHTVRLLGQKKVGGKKTGGAPLDLPKIRKNPLIEIIAINTGWVKWYIHERRAPLTLELSRFGFLFSFLAATHFLLNFIVYVVTRILYQIKITTYTRWVWVFSWLVCQMMYEVTCCSFLGVNALVLLFYLNATRHPIKFGVGEWLTSLRHLHFFMINQNCCHRWSNCQFSEKSYGVLIQKKALVLRGLLIWCIYLCKKHSHTHPVHT